MIVERLVLNHFLDSSAKDKICEVVSYLQVVFVNEIVFENLLIIL